MKKLAIALLLLTACAVSAQTPRWIELAWDHSPDLSHLETYRLYYGTDPATLQTEGTPVDVGLTNRVWIELPDFGTWYFTCTAVGTNSLESVPSNTLPWMTPPLPPTPQAVPYVRVKALAESSTNLVDWVPVEFPPLYLPSTNAATFIGRKFEIEKVLVEE